MTDTPTEREEGGGWAKLRRRKVVQWGLAYAACGWGFLQGLEYVSEAFIWPEQLRQVAIIALSSTVIAFGDSCTGLRGVAAAMTNLYFSWRGS